MRGRMGGEERGEEGKFEVREDPILRAHFLGHCLTGPPTKALG